ncbi:MAG: DUF1577 domain-containing protein [Leptospiraceae bacterium]|nr:DUF1577 domain-containing protein [Leptospiraceae bacterium]MDW7975395.1 DUF1577 domain-containing protein [Leptospiraceae bacterium]
MAIKSDRKLEWFRNPKKIQLIIEKHLLNKNIFLRVLDQPPELKILEILPNSFKLHSEVVLDKEKEYIAYKVLGRYVEIHFEVLSPYAEKGFYEINIKAIGISLTERENVRIPIKNNEIYLTNFLASKHIIDSNTKVIPTTIKIGFSELENQIKQLYDFVKVESFENYDYLLDLVKKTGKIIFIPNTNNNNSFSLEHQEVLNLKEIFHSELNEVIYRYRKEQVKSEIVAPFYYQTHDRNYIPIGYIQIRSKQKELTWDDVEKIKSWNQELISRLQQINTIPIQEKEEVLNISRNGFRTKIKHLKLINYLLRQSGFSCDIVFKGHNPISIYSEIRSSVRDDNGILYIGAKIIEFKNKEQKELYEQILKAYEKRYAISQSKES